MKCEERLGLKGSQEFRGVVKTGRGHSACLGPRPGCFGLGNLPCEHRRRLSFTLESLAACSRPGPFSSRFRKGDLSHPTLQAGQTANSEVWQQGDIQCN